MFDHLILTRLNTGLFSKNPRGIANPDAWMHQRVEMFITYTLPSLKKQTCCNFTWLVHYDGKTPDHYMNVIKERASDFENIRFVQGNPPRSSYASYLSSNYLITTRIDSDDAFALTAINEIQANFKCQDLEFVNLSMGALFDLRKNRIAFARDDSNPFLSLIEKVRSADGIKTVLCSQHQHVAQVGNVVQVNTNQPMWLQIIHENNLANRFKGKTVTRNPKPFLSGLFGASIA